MSAINTQAPVVPDPASQAPKDPTFREILQDVAPLILFVPVAGPPAILLVGPLFLLVLLLIPPTALLMTLVIVFLIGAVLLAALGALVASPHLLVRHVRARRALARSEAGVSQVPGASDAAVVSQPGAVADCIFESTPSPVGA